MDSSCVPAESVFLFVPGVLKQLVNVRFRLEIQKVYTASGEHPEIPPSLALAMSLPGHVKDFGHVQ